MGVKHSTDIHTCQVQLCRRNRWRRENKLVRSVVEYLLWHRSRKATAILMRDVLWREATLDLRASEERVGPPALGGRWRSHHIRPRTRRLRAPD